MPAFRAPRSVAAMIGNRAQYGALDFVTDFNPLSGPAGTGAGSCGKGSTITNTLTGAIFYNEGTAVNPYWTPIEYTARGLLGWHSEFSDGSIAPVADVTASFTLAGSGLRVFGTAQPVADGGLTVAHALGGSVGSMFAGATSGVMIALGVGGATVPFKPSTMGPLAIDAMVANLSAVTLRRFFMGFVGTAADALVSPATGTTITITNVQTDLAGFMFDVGLTAATSLFATKNKGNDTPTHLVTAPNVATGAVVAGDVYQRLRVEVDTLGNARFFIDKLLVTTHLLALTPATNVAPVLALHSTSAAAKTLLVKSFATWGNRL